jgi:hypothetical protein
MHKFISMKVISFLGVLVIVLTLASCDKVKEPNPPAQNAVTVVDTTTPSVVTKSLTNVNFKKALIEDYTGHKCGNCPQAAVEAEIIKTQMGDSVTVLAIHAGFFAKTDINYTTSYTTTVGNDWDASTGFDIGAYGNPNGMVNRINFPTNHVKGYSTWKSLASQEVKKPQQVKINMITKYDTVSRGLNVYTTATFKQALTGDYYLNLVYFEDGIVGKQKYYLPAPGKDSVGYVFNHVLRGSINGSWGDLLISNPSSTSIVSKKYFSFGLPANVNDKKIHIVALVYNNTSKEIIQVEELKIK